MTWPMVATLGTHIDNPGDPIFTSWLLPRNVHATFHHTFDWFQGNIFAPEPDTVAYADHMIALLPIAAPIWFLTHDGVVTNNLTVLVLVFLNGWCAYLLSRELTGSRTAALVGGVIFGFSPFVFSRIGHTNILSVWGFPLAWLFARRIVRAGRWWDVLGLAGAVVVCTYSSWYFLVFSGLLVGVVLGVEVLTRWREIRFPALALRLMASAIIVLLAILAVARPYFVVQDRYPQATRTLDEAVHYSAVPSSLYTAPPNNRLYGDLTEPFRALSAGYNERMMFLGVAPAVLALCGLYVAVRRRRADLSLAAISLLGGAAVFAFGPYQFRDGERVRMPFFHLYEALPPLQFMRSPGRASLFLYLVMGALAAYLLSNVRGRLRPVLVAAVCLVVAAEYASAPLPSTPLHSPPAQIPKLRPSASHRWLAEQREPGAVLELPTGEIVDGAFTVTSLLREGAYMYFSTVHWRDLLNGYSGFAPPTYREMVETVKTFPDDRSLALLRDRGVRFVLVHRDLVAGTPWAALGDGVNSPDLSVAHDDGRVRVYRLQPRSGQ